MERAQRYARRALISLAAGTAVVVALTLVAVWPCVLQRDAVVAPLHDDARREWSVRLARGFGVQTSFPSNLWLLRIPIDHVLVACAIGVDDRRIGPEVGSDHLPVITDLVVPP